ncbi:DUF4375 domain-containing protein [uncultured Sphingomonas sp.]|uniref:DMP19 family protein n=1 Tax=uncultured Sphingomonas sp. TaxID=158754 RepID=UPI0025EC5077|nr:DUF4375 domain-containing protein [uncultured Sphingomonas sp.]
MILTKRPCRDCGAMILPVTFEATGGLCMACKQGIGKDMDAARARYALSKAYDPMRALWEFLVLRSVEDRHLVSWPDTETMSFAVGLLDGEVCDGGFDEYVHNSARDHFRLALDGLETIGARRSRQIGHDAADMVFGGDGPPASQQARWTILKSRTRRLFEIVSRHRTASRLDRLDHDFSSDPDQRSDRLAAFANASGLVTPFQVDPT